MPVDDAVCIAADLLPYDYAAREPLLFGRDTEYFPHAFAAERRALDLSEAAFVVPFARRAMAPMRPPGASAVASISWGGSGMTSGSSANRA